MCKQLSGWLIQIFIMGKGISVYDVWSDYAIGIKMCFLQKNRSMSLMTCICIPLFTTVLSVQILSYYLLCALLLSMPFTPIALFGKSA